MEIYGTLNDVQLLVYLFEKEHTEIVYTLYELDRITEEDAINAIKQCLVHEEDLPILSSLLKKD